ncbi:MAG: cation transporter [Deltaproteobacteria bacterium]|nr:cation transporter [Deltaproteobacteria bacterium]
MGQATPPNGQKIIETVLGLAPHVEIAHHIPGRIRLRIRGGAAELAGRVDVERAASFLPGVRSIRLNLLARSIVIEYDPARIAPDLWEQVATLHRHPETAPAVAARLEELLRA